MRIGSVMIDVIYKLHIPFERLCLFDPKKKKLCPSKKQKKKSDVQNNIQIALHVSIRKVVFVENKKK